MTYLPLYTAIAKAIVVQPDALAKGMAWNARLCVGAAGALHAAIVKFRICLYKFKCAL